MMYKVKIVICLLHIFTAYHLLCYAAMNESRDHSFEMPDGLDIDWPTSEGKLKIICFILMLVVFSIEIAMNMIVQNLSGFVRSFAPFWK